MKNYTELDTATFGGGCFWCIEAIFEQVNGVKQVVSGYAGGHTINPTYKQVCTGETGHAEVCQITFDKKIISYQELLLIFFSSHDPTTPGRQGADIGTQYRSVIFYHDTQQKNIAENFMNVFNEQKVFDNPLVTELKTYTTFYPAENYHQQYFDNNSSQPYCRIVIAPKLEKIKKELARYLK
ncbi:MAG TPA: peptide-methionine (S)-S-oxide reductase MsrA [Bacteroidales bacterium]|nr:peptide-methionine (S)-S-oxide reductase MsrA [Bacteroidales bacterium]